MGIIEDITRDLNEKFGWTVVSVDAQAGTAVVRDGEGNETVLERWVIEDISADTIARVRIERRKEQLEGAILADIGAFERNTNLPVSSVSLASETDAEGAQRVVGVTVRVDYSL